MRRVIDASSAFQWAVVEVDSDKALRIRDDLRRGACTHLVSWTVPRPSDMLEDAVWPGE
jgi:hypothetical protein